MLVTFFFYEEISVTTFITLSHHSKFIGSKANHSFARLTRTFGSVFGQVCTKDYGHMDGWTDLQMALWMRDRAFY